MIDVKRTKLVAFNKRVPLVAFAFSQWALLIVCVGCSALTFWEKPPAPATVAAKVQSDVIYSRSGGEELTMDVFFPTNVTGRNLPVVLYVHGGGWQMGSKSMLSMMPGPSELLRRGYLVVTMNYRLAPRHKFPAMIEDAKCAVRFLRAHAKDFRLDPARIGVMGDSSGGHLVALLGLTYDSAGFEGAGWTDQSSRVQAVVDLYGPTDFASGNTNFITLKLIHDAFGATNTTDPILKRANPVTYVSSRAPPFLILHGDMDNLVDLQQSAELDARLKAAGVDSTFVVITNFAHGYVPLGLKSSPDNAELSNLIADFFDRNLR
jgi:acetyl esterase/lipase